jgi:death on curing protein
VKLAQSLLSEAAVLAAHEQQIAEHGGSPGVRDRSLLESALARAQQKANYAEPDAADLAAVYAYGIVRNHPFVDGNKRIALIATETFLFDNGYELEADDRAIYEATIKLAASEMSESEFAGWLCSNMTGGAG